MPLDIGGTTADLDLVINYHIARDTEVHTHRIGRTGRAGSKGMACSLYSDKEHYKVALLGDELGAVEPGLQVAHEEQLLHRRAEQDEPEVEAEREEEQHHQQFLHHIEFPDDHPSSSNQTRGCLTSVIGHE